MNTLLTNQRFDGFQATPFLWEGSLAGLEMFEQADEKVEGYPVVDTDAHIRLGKLVEQFVSYELDQDKTIQIIQSNVQVFQNQVTVGEIDLLINQLEAYLHLEIVYKFYLYDPSIPDELHRWIGPNRKDSLVYKLTKLKEKQLPLLYHPATAYILNGLNLTSDKFVQRLYFKAQLFVPLDHRNVRHDLINNECIKGFYVRFKDLTNYTHCTFYIPPKLDWLIEPHLEVDWLSYKDFETVVAKTLNDRSSPLCWMKLPEGSVQKLFVVWWD
ncbi:DUF1853 family protein [Fulvivirga lutimaris]|uniref:DUF1853 family protein n=1 Tax=Fulvivirga lutimaris TaxID=1819566 RepID=UPI0012BBB608|nr:DUF1853 family protein [Fulvivirga lutimaris]MTI41549.1 DUF1853 family protein [Fulvivirga lutimaris]